MSNENYSLLTTHDSSLHFGFLIVKQFPIIAALDPHFSNGKRKVHLLAFGSKVNDSFICFKSGSIAKRRELEIAEREILHIHALQIGEGGLFASRAFAVCFYF